MLWLAVRHYSYGLARGRTIVVPIGGSSKTGYSFRCKGSLGRHVEVGQDDQEKSKIDLGARSSQLNKLVSSNESLGNSVIRRRSKSSRSRAFKS